jgi:hypothetical protein
MKVVVENSEATLAFRELAAVIMRFVAGEQGVELIEPMQRCLVALEQGDGVLKFVDFTPESGDEDEAINTVIRGVLHMVAGLLFNMDTHDDEYQDGLSELARGVVLMNQKINAARKRQRR